MIPKGFKLSAHAAGIKKPDWLDMGLILADGVVPTAGVFTRNKVVAAPVEICRAHLARTDARALLVNSGNANACTGQPGFDDAVKLVRGVAERLGCDPHEVLICSTGVIGLPLPMERMEAGLTPLVRGAGDDVASFARSILTTDTCTKVSTATVEIGGTECVITGVAKGSGMIRPDMATMLGFILTDATLGRVTLQRLLTQSVDASFNRITVDGDTSTNDTVIAMASGGAGTGQLEDDPAGLEAFTGAFQTVCEELAEMIVTDGEGVTKVVKVIVRNARDDAAAMKIAETICHSPLVKTAIHGEDPNWGRIAGALGRSAGYEGTPFTIRIGGHAVAVDGMNGGPDVEHAAHEVMKNPRYEIEVELGEGDGHGYMITTDFSADYVRINADYRS